MKKASLFLLAMAVCAIMAAQPKVVGHRGCRYAGPFENTLASLKVAQAAGVDAVEFDVHLTADDEVIVFHGPQVPGVGKDVREMSFAEARKAVLPGGHRMPTLPEWFRQANRHPEITLIMEIKAQLSDEKLDLLVDMAMQQAAKYKGKVKVEYTSFSTRACDRIRAKDALAKVIYLDSGVGVPDAAWAKERGYSGISYNLDAFLNRPEIVAQARQLGIETTLWLVNDYEVADWAIRHGINFISSDFPEKLVPYIDAVKAYRQ